MKIRSLFVVLGMTGVASLAGARGVSAQSADPSVPDPAASVEMRLRDEAARTMVPQVLGDTAADLVFTPVTPCRIIDTRAAGGAIATDSTRSFLVSGTTGFDAQGGKVGGCGIPASATSVEMNFVAVGANGPGDLRAYPYNAAPVVPTASVLNYANVPGLNIANGIAQPVCNVATTTCTFHLIIQADAAATHVVVDVVGYYAPANKAQVKSFVVTSESRETQFIAATCTHYKGLGLLDDGGVVTVTAPAGVAGKALVRANVTLEIAHTTGTADGIQYGLGTTPTDCTSVFGGYGNLAYQPAALPTATYISTGTVFRVFDVAAGATASFFLNGRVTSGLNPTFANDAFTSAGMEATFIPN